MKLALIRRQFAATGGAELYLQRLLAALVGAGHDVHLFTEKWQGAPTGVVIHPITVKGTRSVRPVHFAETVAREVEADRFDCVFSLERTCSQDVYRAGDGLHRVWLEQRRRFATWWRRPFIGMGAFHSNMMALESRTFDPALTRHIIVNSEMVRAEILQHFRFPAERIHLVRNGVDVARFQKGEREATRQRFGFAPADFVLLFVGSGWERKGLGFLLKLMQQYAGSGVRAPSGGEIKLLVVGKGHLSGKVPANVVLAGPMAAVEDAYAAADLFTFLPIYEPSSNVVIEALASGLPVITSAFNGAAEVLEEGINGTVLADPADTAALADAVQTWMVRNPSRPVPCKASLDLDTNVALTLRILEEATVERH